MKRHLTYIIALMTLLACASVAFGDGAAEARARSKEMIQRHRARDRFIHEKHQATIRADRTRAAKFTRSPEAARALASRRRSKVIRSRIFDFDDDDDDFRVLLFGRHGSLFFDDDRGVFVIGRLPYDRFATNGIGHRTHGTFGTRRAFVHSGVIDGHGGRDIVVPPARAYRDYQPDRRVVVTPPKVERPSEEVQTALREYESRLERARAHFQTGDYYDAAAFAVFVKQMQPDNVPAARLVVLSLTAVGQHKAASQALWRLLSRDMTGDRQEMLLASAADLYEDRLELGRHIGAVQQAARSADDDRKLQLLLAYLHALAGQRAKARKVLESITDTDPAERLLRMLG